jgi:hypothetical protein
MCDIGVIGNEALVEVGKVKEGVDILNLGWDGPAGNPIKFHGVHVELTGFDDYSKVVHFRDSKSAFLELEMPEEGWASQRNTGEQAHQLAREGL